MTDTTTDKGLVERLREEAQRFEFEAVMKWWDGARKLIADGFRGSKPRDEFEALIDGVSDLLTEAAADIERLERERDEAEQRKSGYLARFTEELKRRKVEEKTVDRVWKALGINTYEEAGGKEISEIVAELRARCEAAESRLSRITAPVEGLGLETCKEEWAIWTERRHLSAEEIEDALLFGAKHGNPACGYTLPLSKMYAAVPRMIRGLESLSARLRVAEEALEPFADAVFNDNGDVTFDHTTYSSDDLWKAYSVLRRAASIRARGES